MMSLKWKTEHLLTLLLLPPNYIFWELYINLLLDLMHSLLLLFLPPNCTFPELYNDPLLDLMQQNNIVCIILTSFAVTKSRLYVPDIIIYTEARQVIILRR